MSALTPAGYPTPAQLALPSLDPTPDQELHAAWRVQHDRLWVAFAGAGGVSVLLLILLLVQTARFKPAIHYVTLEGGYIVTWNQGGNAVIDGVEYVPARLRAVVSTFLETRYEYDWQNLDKIRTALNLMGTKAAEEEREKIRDLSPASNIVAAHLKVELRPDYSKWQVIALGKGVFQVTIGGYARINDIVRFPDPNRPLIKRFEVRFVLKTVPATDENPHGYEVISTGKDPIL